MLKKDFAVQERLHAFLFENMEDAAVYTAVGPGEEEVVLAANQRACALSGYRIDELIGMPRDALFCPEDGKVQAAVHARRASGAFIGELQLRRKEGSAVPVELSSRLVAIGGGRFRSVSILRDVSWRNARERALADRARFEAMVELTGGIAHDCNNFLTVVLGSLDALEDSLPQGSRERRLVANAVLGATRTAALTRQLLTHARRSRLQSAPMRWEPFLSEVEGLLACTLGETSAVRLDLEPELPVCEVDVAQLTSALLNLAANARDAMPGGGILTLRVRRRTFARADCGPDGHVLPAGDYVELCASDTGAGILPEALRRIFEPFFTTKETGSGLGLAMVQGFVRQSGGDIRASSREGCGTQFQMLFPVAREEAASLESASPPPVGETVLRWRPWRGVRRSP